MARRRGGFDVDRVMTLGGTVPRSVGGLLAAMVVATVAAILSPRAWALLCLDGPSIFDGQVWRLVTWVLPQGDPLSLILAGFVLHWLGRDLVASWGERRFLQVYAGYAVWSALWTAVWGALTVGEAWGGPRTYVGAWPVLIGLLVGWGLARPAAQIRFFGILPMTGRVFAWITVGGTLLFAITAPARESTYAPHLAALGLAFLLDAGVTPRRLWLRAKERWYAARMRRRARHLRAVPRDDKPKWMN